MATTYKVQKGDTRSAIAQRLGVPLSEVGMGRSGNPDLIMPDEILQVGQKNPAQSYASEVRTGLDAEAPTTPQGAGDFYDLTKLRADTESYKTNLDAAFKKYQGIQSKTYDDEYAKRGLDKKKERIASLDETIAAKKKDRDAALAKVGWNPNISAATMTGDMAKIRDSYNAELQTSIDERNSLASEYNTDLDEIDKVSSRAAADAKAEYDYYAGLLSNTQGTIKDYQGALADELRADTQADQFERQLAQTLQIAQLNASKKGGSGDDEDWKLALSPITGKPQYWYNADGQIRPLTEAEKAAGGSASSGDESGPNFEDKVEPAPASGGGWLQGVKNWFKGWGK